MLIIFDTIFFNEKNRLNYSFINLGMNFYNENINDSTEIKHRSFTIARNERNIDFLVSRYVLSK